ncbi:MAG: hypothetical protein H0W83_07970, partial [Planctomycetes bacterium]|nr:hypothetical protein [Planctomycetota bacterium]
MADIDPSVWLFCGAVAGAFVAWMVLRGKAADAYRHGAAEGDSERATIAERLSGVEAQLQEARATIIA